MSFRGEFSWIIRRVFYVRPSIKILFAVFLPIQESWPFGCFFQNFGPVLSDFFTWIIGGRVRQRCTLGNFQCRSVLLFWIIVGRTVLAVGAGRSFRLSSPIISLFPYRLKYCLKGQLKPKQQQQHKFNFGYSLTELKLPVKDGKQCWPWPDCSLWILPSGPALLATAFKSLLVLSGTWKKSLSTEIVCSGANKHFLKDGLRIALYFTHPYLWNQLNLLIY